MDNPFKNIIEDVSSLTIGQVESVSPNEIKVLLEPQAPQATSLNTGIPSGFPRINNYLLIPNEVGAVVGLIVWVGIERSKYPQRPGMVKDFGLVDLPYPLRKLAIVPLGTLVAENIQDAPNHFRLKRGVTVFPSVGDSVLLPTNEQLKAIIQAPDKEDQRLGVGISPLAGNAKITVDPDKLFGRHLAVLGNTGSGKSCSVAGLIRWSLQSSTKTNRKPNARFIILDPNGEYSKSFSDLGARIFRVSPTNKEEPLRVPAWMWNSHEWSAFCQAAPRMQRPLLQQALREVKEGQRTAESLERTIARSFRTFYRTLIADRSDSSRYMEKPGKNDFGQKLQAFAESAVYYAQQITENKKSALETVANTIKAVAAKRYKTFVDDRTKQTVEYYQAFNDEDVDAVIDIIDKYLEGAGVSHSDLSVSEDAPIPFDGQELADHIEQLGTQQGSIQYLDTLILRIRMMMADGRLGPVVKRYSDITLENWLEKYIGSDAASNGPIAVLDLSLIPSEVIHTIIAVIARIVFEATQRYKRINGASLPTVLVLEEAHTFVRRGGDSEEQEILSPAQMCRQTFERIAREGRKFGLGLVLSSQRPSELSPTVLAQCNTFLLHRIVNDRDQELVSKLVPDNLGGLLKELPSLPSRRAILLGWACSLPTLVDIHELSIEQRPKSEDPDFWDVWTGTKDRPINWKKIADEWTKNQGQSDSSVGPSTPTRPSN
ncbi:MAG: ATP-binding protein [Promethearchaeota archaeon]